MNNLYVVEGKTDYNKLISCKCKYIYCLNGLEGLNEVKLNFLKEVNKVRTIVLVLDPDGPGKNIIQILTKCLTSFLVVKVNKDKAKKHGKIGIAETDMSYLLSKLKPYIDFDLKNEEIPSLTMLDLKQLNLSQKELSFLHKIYNINTYNYNKMLRELIFLNVSKENIMEKLHNECFR